ncbi:MAG: hypothetical protein LC785_01020 [Acidobacteria bacterium]|nr:hypothetical protein [Acidobacteriota bacterium]MCA1640569.1 hypothetical protein [Acidobacteriota bacterium]
MFGKKAHDISDDRLDTIAREALRAAARGADDAADAAASSPFLYTRIAARIEERRRAGNDEGWLALLAVAWRAVPVMAVVAMVAAALLFWIGISGASASSNQMGYEALLDTRGSGLVTTVLAERDQLSHDDVLDIVVEREETEAHQ